MKPRTAVAVLATLLLGGAAAPNAAGQAPPPEVLGYDPVADARLPAWSEMLGYFETLASRSARVRVDTIGRSTLDAPLVVLTVSSAGNLERLEELRAIQAELADPRRIESPERREELIGRGRLVALVTAGTHSTEVGGPLAVMRLAHHLATSPSSRARAVREAAVVLLVPAVNPDGVDLVQEWYESTAGTPWRGSDPPFLYHHYAGHDLNRDWYSFTQRETRLLVERVHQRWHPQLHLDLHQHEPNWVRHVVPPWIDPVEPNVDPLLISAATSLGTRVQWTLLEEGRTGVAVAARYDAWSPSRAYAHYHGGVRILSETASVRLAAPVELAPETLESVAGLDSRVSTWNHPIPWPGGRWTLGDVVGYMESSALAALGIAADQRASWLRNFERVGRRAVEGWPAWPDAWVIPAEGGGWPAARHELLRILRTAGLEIRRLERPFTTEEARLEPGDHVIDMHQPYGAFAQVLLERGRYPGRRLYEDGPPAAPYDATAHDLGLLLGVDVRPVHAPLPAGALSEPLSELPPPPPRRVEELSGDPAVMVGLYRPWTASAAEGWIRWVFDGHSVPYAPVTNADLARARPLRDFTALVLPPEESDRLREGRTLGDVPPEYAGGIGEIGADRIATFVEEGGTLVAIGPSADYAIEALGLPVENVVSALPRSEFYAPGVQVGIEVDSSTFVGAGLPTRTAAMLMDAAAFRIAGEPGDGADAAADSARVVVRYARDRPVRSGWMVGASRIAGRAAVVDGPAVIVDQRLASVGGFAGGILGVATVKGHIFGRLLRCPVDEQTVVIWCREGHVAK
ncbi:MAG: M14 family zinc carboxypeptidase [Gemmatimonadota bacterium]